jgi:hypothetical protein
MTWSEMIVAVFKKCGARGANLHETRTSQRHALQKPIDFFTKTLKP